MWKQSRVSTISLDGFDNSKRSLNSQRYSYLTNSWSCNDTWARMSGEVGVNVLW